MPYSLGVDRLEKIEPAKIKSKLSEDDERKLTTDMRELFDRLKPTERVKENREKLVRKLETIFNEEWPGHDIRVHLFGSSGNKLCSDDSDGTSWAWNLFFFYKADKADENSGHLHHNRVEGNGEGLHDC